MPAPIDIVNRTAIVIAKRPVPGRVKTRLCPPLTPAAAADVAAAALSDTLDAIDRFAFKQRRLCFAGSPVGWRRPGWQYRSQSSGDLDERLAAAFRTCHGPTVLVGMDTPQLTGAHLAAFDPTRFDACLGPTFDGGYWTIGFSDPIHARDTIRGVPMSTEHTFEAQRARLAGHGLRVQILQPLRDVDTIDDAHAVAASVPRSRFGHAVTRATTGQRCA